jgi:hypothetical protein
MALNSHWPTHATCNKRWLHISTLFLLFVAALPGLARHRAVGKPATLGAVVGQEAVVTNYGDAPVSVQRCVAETCETEQLSPGAAKRYAITSPVMRIGQVSPGTIDVTTDGITLPSVLFLQNTKIIPGTYDLQAFRQRIGIVSDWAGAISVKSIAHNGTIQDLRNVPIDKGVTYVDPSAVFNVEPNFQFEITDSVAAFAEWTNKTTGQVTRIPAVRVEDALNEAYLARVTPTTTLLVKNALLVQQGGVNLWFLPAAGITVPTLVRGTLIVPYGMISTTDIPTFAGGTGDGSLKITGAPEGQNLLPFYAWAFNDGVPYPLTRFQQAATAHGPGADPTPYQNARWTGLRTDATHHTTLALQNIDYQPNIGTLTLDDQGTTFAAQTITLAPYASQQLTLDDLAGSHALYSATLQLNDDPNNPLYHTPRVTGAALVAAPNGATARPPVILPRTAVVPHYDIRAEIYVHDHGQTFMQVTNPTAAVMQKLLNVDNLSFYDNKLVSYACDAQPDPVVNSLPELIANYNAKLTIEEKQNFSGDEVGFRPFAANPCNDAALQNVYLVRITYSHISPSPYDVTATIRVRDNGQTFEQITHPAITTVQKLVNVNNPDALVGSHGYDCAPAPDPVVNSIPELLANYAKLTPAEQLEFSGDREGFSPFATNVCDTTKTQYVLFISIAVAKRDLVASVTAEQYVALWMPNDAIWLNPSEAKDLITRYKHDFATELNNTPNSPGIAFIESYLADLVDGVISTSNEELWGNGDPLLISIPAGKVEFYKINAAGSTVRVDDISLPLDALQRVRDNIVRPELTYLVRTSPTSYGGSTSTGPRLSFNPRWTTQDATSVTAQVYVDHFLLPLRSDRLYLNLTETRCMLTGACGVRSYALDLAAIIQPNYTSSWSTPEALAAQLQAWVDGNDTNGELLEGRDPFSYVNIGSPLGVGVLLKPLGGAVPFNLSAAQMTSVYAVLRSFLIEYVTVHPESYGGTANGYNLSIDPTWSSQDAVQQVSGEQYVTKWLDSLQTQGFYLSNTEVKDLFVGGSGVRSFGPDLASVLVGSMENTGGTTAAQLALVLSGWVDGNSANGELYGGFDPMNVNMRSNPHPGVVFYFPPTGDNTSPFTLDPAAAQKLYAVIRESMRLRVEANPTLYGGSANTGPRLSFNPTWATQDPN